MPSAKAESAPVISGIGVATAFGYGVSTFRQALRQPGNRFGVMQRPGRHALDATFPGAELPDPPAGILAARIARTTGLTGHVAVAVLQEAWRDANLDRVAPEKIGLVIGGSNTQAREHLLIQQSYAAKLHFLSPQYGHRFFDSDLCGLCTSVFPIRGFAYTLGGASASGLLAVQHAADAVRSGRVEACIALGALQDLSYFECQALRSLGAMGSVCRPFDQGRDGFVFGECSAALVLSRSGPGYGRVLGAAHIADGNRGPEPSLDGEVRAIRMALADAGIAAEEIDYVNPHGTGSPLGDDTEVAALREAGLTHARINATKSIIGHGLSAAGAVELVAVLLQMTGGFLHPTRNLENPIAPDLHWANGESFQARTALKLSFGFGGINTALVAGALEA
jgi:malonyl-ACP decarboxylase